MSLWACICHWRPQKASADAFPWCFQGAVPYALLRSMLVAFSQLPDSKMLCRSALMSLAALGSSNSMIATQVPSLLLVLYREGPVLPADVWMPLVPLLDHLSQYSPEAAELGSRLRALASGNFSTATQMAQTAQTNTFAQGPMSTGSCRQFQPAQTGPQDQAFGRAWPQHSQQGNPAQSQGAHGSMHPLSAGTQFVPLASDKSKAVTHKPPSVGLHNENNTCYMNCFVQGLFLTDAFLWRIYNFNLKLKNNPSKMDEEDYEFGKKVVELLQKQFAKMALTKHQHTDIWDILQAFPCRVSVWRAARCHRSYAMRFVFDKLGGSDQQLLKEVFACQLHEMTQCKECGNVKVREETFTEPCGTSAYSQGSQRLPWL